MSDAAQRKNQTESLSWQANGGVGSTPASLAQQIIFHVTAYNSQVEKILDVKLVQPGT